MRFFDFHHHDQNLPDGIYNLNLYETPARGRFSAGIHPAEAAGFGKDHADWLERCATLENCAAIGECGLDTRVPATDRQQNQVLGYQIQLASALRKPLIIHCVRRFPELLKAAKTAGVPMALHGFNKNEDTAKKLLGANFYLSFGKAALHNVSLQGIIQSCPTDKIFLETDGAAFDIGELYTLAARLKSMSTGDLQNQILENFQKFTR